MTDQPSMLVGVPSAGVYSNCDCACPDHGLVLAPPPAVGSAAAWTITPDLYRDQLLGAAELAFLPTGDGRVVVLNQAATAALDSFHQPRPLNAAASPFSEIANRLAAHRLISPVGASSSLISEPPTTLSAWLHVTNACNLRCSYCYVATNAEAMELTTGQAAVDAVLRSATRGGFRAVQLKYAGGEASLNFALVRALHAYAAKQVRQHQLALSEVLLSNGVALTEAMLAFLRDEGIGLALSLDGLGESHDQQRPFANGHGSAKHVIRTVERAIAVGLAPVLSITVTAGNAHTLADLVNFALEHDLRFNFNFYRSFTGHDPHGVGQAADERMIAGLRAALARMAEQPPRRRLIDGLLDRSSFSQAHHYACGMGRTYLAITQRGGIAPCQMLLHQPVTGVHDPDPLSTLKLHPRVAHNLAVDEKDACAKCTWRYACAGGCPLLTVHSATCGGRSPYCAVYNALYPELLRLEGLRIIRWAPHAALIAHGLEQWV